MARIEQAVSNSGPLIHLSQIGAFRALTIATCILIPPEVWNEVTSSHLPGSEEVKKAKNIQVKVLLKPAKDNTAILSQRFGLDVGEAEALALIHQENIPVFFTDDLEARLIARRLNVKTHGTVGILLRAFREGVFGKDDTIRLLESLHTSSTLFITSTVIDAAINEIKKQRR